MATVILNPPNTLHVDCIYAFLSTDEQGNEGVCAVQTSQGMMPLIAADPERVKSLMKWARYLAAEQGQTGKAIKLVKFSQREELETIRP